MTNSTLTIGQGIYTAADAARILRVPYAKANYWFQYYAKHKFPSTTQTIYHFKIKDIMAVNFLTLIEMIVFYSLKERGIPTGRILEAHTVMSDFLKTPHPFAKEDIYVNEKSLLFGNEEQLLTADKRLQTVLIQVLKPFISKIHFSDQRMARKFYPLGKKKSIVVNPENQFGQPVIEGTNILTQTIFNLLQAGESKKSIAKLYDLTLSQVNDAIEFSKAA
jgi:uncharacterized protein (DUF433 family)